MRVPTFLRVWRIPVPLARCRNCKAYIRFVYLDTGKRLPLEEHATPVRQETDAHGGKFDIYLADASHLWHCPKKPR